MSEAPEGPAPDSTPEAGYDIAELARGAGVSSRTIRYYGELGLLRANGRGPGGRRHYDAEALERLLFITRLKQLGLTLEQIGKLNHTFDQGQTPSMLKQLDLMLGRRLDELHARLRELQDLESDLQTYRQRIRAKLDHIHN